MEEMKITNEDIQLLKEMKSNCLKSSVYEDDKRLLKANVITKFLVEHQEKQEIIDYLKERINECKLAGSYEDYIKIDVYEEILSKIEKR